jgi:hypothetical protein
MNSHLHILFETTSLLTTSLLMTAVILFILIINHNDRS